jgi:two-component system cell cycle response regulator DivK
MSHWYRLNRVSSGEIDLVLLDVSLNNSEWEGRSIDGVELCRMLKNKSPRRLPVLSATAHAMSGDRERLLETSGADGYREKPVYDSAILVQKVRSLIKTLKPNNHPIIQFRSTGLETSGGISAGILRPS